MLKLGFIGGGGWLSTTIIRALVQEGLYMREEIGISYRSKPANSLEVGLETASSQELVNASEIVVVSVRPADFAQVNVDASGKLVVSVMAGISIERIAEATRANRIVRAMPNVAASVGQSYTPWVASADVNVADRQTVTRLLEACGVSDEVRSERELDYLTALSGSGPAFPTLLAAALSIDAVAHGLNQQTAERAVVQMLIGTGRLLEREARRPAEVVAEFVEYRGVVAAAIEEMQSSGFDKAVQRGMAAALVNIRALSES